jgi:hypothetical protein
VHSWQKRGCEILATKKSAKHPTSKEGVFYCYA